MTRKPFPARVDALEAKVAGLELQAARLAEITKVLAARVEALENAAKAGQAVLPPLPPRASMMQIAGHHAIKSGLSVKELRSPNRTRAVAWPRQDAMTDMKDTGHSYGQIALFFGVDHTTVISGVAASRKRRGGDEKAA